VSSWTGEGNAKEGLKLRRGKYIFSRERKAFIQERLAEKKSIRGRVIEQKERYPYQKDQGVLDGASWKSQWMKEGGKPRKKKKHGQRDEIQYSKGKGDGLSSRATAKRSGGRSGWEKTKYVEECLPLKGGKERRREAVH